MEGCKFVQPWKKKKKPNTEKSTLEFPSNCLHSFQFNNVNFSLTAATTATTCGSPHHFFPNALAKVSPPPPPTPDHEEQVWDVRVFNQLVLAASKFLCQTPQLILATVNYHMLDWVI